MLSIHKDFGSFYWNVGAKKFVDLVRLLFQVHGHELVVWLVKKQFGLDLVAY